MDEETKFPIDRFRNIASWMSEVDRRLNSLEAQLKTTSVNGIHDSGRIRQLEEFAASLKVVLQPPQEVEKS
jgi:hypothetical protein